MAKSHNSQPPPGFLTGGNSQEIGLGLPRKNQPSFSRGFLGSSTWPILPNDDQSHRPHPTTDDHATTVDRLVARIQQLEATLADTTRRPSQPVQPTPADYELSFDHEYNEPITRPRQRYTQHEFPLGFNHIPGGGARGRRGGFHGFQGRPIHRDDDGLVYTESRGPNLLHTGAAPWDRGVQPYWDEEERDHRQGTSWESPLLRQHGPLSRYDAPRDIKMEAPKFDGSEASNWISRVQYYFDHFEIPEHDRLHYVVMLFQPPASEWIFNYCAHKPVVSWTEFLADVRHRFDPHSFTNSIGPLSKLVQTGSVADYHTVFE